MTKGMAQVEIEKLRELAKRRIVLHVPGMYDIEIRRDETYGTHADAERALDVYLPPEAGHSFPAVIFVAGYSDAIGRSLVGFGMREMGSYVSWAQLVAVSGLVGITYSSANPPEDARVVLKYVREHAQEFNIDPERIGIWAASGNGPAALSMLTDSAASLQFAVLSNTYMLDLAGDSTVAEMSKRFGFAAPNDGKTVGDLDPGVPLFVVRSGQDEVPGLNGSIDRFVASAIELNRSIRFANLPDAPHSFDTLHDTNESREVIRQILEFMLSNSRT